MFLDNKYTKWYYTIIESAKAAPFVGYTENHHIIPKSFGGLNEKSNLVRLSARQHFIAHRLLIKMTTGQNRKKMYKALWNMKHTRGLKLSSRQFETLRCEYSKSVSEFWKGRKMSPSHYANFLAGRATAKANGVRYGGMHSDTHRKIMIESNKRRRGIKMKPQPGKSAGSKNSNAKTWVLEDEFGNQQTFLSIKPWCISNKMIQATLVKKSEQGVFYKGWRIISKS